MPSTISRVSVKALMRFSWPGNRLLGLMTVSCSADQKATYELPAGAPDSVIILFVLLLPARKSALLNVASAPMAP